MFPGGQTTAAGLNEAKMKMLALTRRFTEAQPSSQMPANQIYGESVQTTGVKRDNKEYFMQCRKKSVDEVAVYTNTLIIRLDKIVNANLDDSNKRKAFEQEMVPWLDDKEARACQSCGAKFHMARRRHHCRLCGKIMCNPCSKFMPFVTARKITNPAFAAQILNGISEEEKANIAAPETTTSFSAFKQHTGKLFAMLKNDGSETSLSSLLQQEQDECVRMCENCKGLLDRRDEQMDHMTSSPIIVQFYEQLCVKIDQAHKLASSYLRMAESLNAGESLYTLDDAVQMSKKLKTLHKQIDMLSLKIEEFGTNNPTKQPCPTELKLQRFIRFNALQVVSQSPALRVNLPAPEEYEKLQKRFKMRVQEQIEKARSLRVTASSSSLEQHNLAESSRPIRPNMSFSGHSQTEAGWNPETRLDKNPFTEDESEPLHPVQQQFVIVKGYLRQAAEDGRLEEVKLLEQNLQMIEMELKKLSLANL